MSGHSHWATIKHKKGAADAKKGKLFSKCAKALSIAARDGGGDPDSNLALKYAIDRARAVNMPRENIERAIKKGTGELEGASFEEVLYEGYGPGGVAIMVRTVTDNRNRTSGELRKIFERHGGSIGSKNCVAWQFHSKAFVTVDAAKYPEDKVMEAVLEAGAEDLSSTGTAYEITGPADTLAAIRKALSAAGIEAATAEVTSLPTARVELEASSGRKALSLLSALEDHDDVENTTTNLDVTDEMMKAFEEEAE
jgi:YebC/PmpR family DNA-binding regulatory protein